MHTDLNMEALSNHNRLPRMDRATKETVLPLNPMKLSMDDHDELMDEAHRREDFDYEEELVMDDDDDHEYDSESDDVADGIGDWMSDDDESDDNSMDEDDDEDDDDN